MTEKLYYDLPYMQECQARILEKEAAPEGWWIRLDRTLFYPEGGGQPDDHGTINGIRLIRSRTDGSVIWHLLESEPAAAGTEADCQLDWQRRFDHMQQHAGQHILSGVADKMLDAATVGFHLSAHYTTVDLDIPRLTAEQLAELEQVSNDMVFSNIPFKCYFATADELAELKLRRQPKVKENIRIVEVEDYDWSPCGGTHPARTGEVGLIKIIKTERIRNCVRIHLVCGGRALRNYEAKTRLIAEMIEMTSSPEQDLATHLQRLLDNERAKSKQINHLTQSLLFYRAAELIESAAEINGYRLIEFTSDEFNPSQIKMLGAAIAKQCEQALVMLASTGDGGVPRLLVSATGIPDVHIGKIYKSVITEFGGRGGGNAQSAQGNCQSEDQIADVFAEIRNRILPTGN